MSSMRAAYQITIAVLLLLSASACQAALDKYSMWLTSHPQAIVADSHSGATITAEVRDSSGRAVPDGTVVDFTASLGIIERRARTAGGIARVRLQSGSTTGTALVSAVATDGNAVAQLRVDFLEQGTEMFDESFISVSSKKYLGYDVDARLVDSAGGVTIYHRGLTIDAEEAQIDVKSNTLRAKAKTGGASITIQRGGKKLLASALCYDFNSMKGVLLTPATDGAKRMLFRGRDLFCEPDKDPSETVKFGFQPITSSKLFIRAASLLIRPGQEIKFKRAHYYVDGDKLLSVPLQVVPLGGDAGPAGQMLTYGTEGLRVDLPFYYSLSTHGTGSVRLRHSEPTGWGNYSDRAGWQVDVDQEYNAGGSTEGTFSVNRVTSSDWGLRRNHRTELQNDSQVYTYLDFPSHRDLYGTLDYSRSMRDYTWSASFRGNKMRDANGRYSASTYLQSRAKPVAGGALSYALSTRLSYDSELLDSGDKLGTGLGLQLYCKPIQFGPAAGLNTSLNVARDWGGSNAGTSVFANTSLFRTLGTTGQLSLNYSYSWADSRYGYNSQRISANLSLNPSKRWSTNLYAVYGLGEGSMSAFGDLGYTFLPAWRLSLLGTLQDFQYAKFSDAEIALSKLIGRQEARLTWSQSRKKFRLEFSAAQF